MQPTSTPIPGPLSQARFLHRPNRFLLQVRLEDTGYVVEAHMADPGRLKELLIPEKRIWLRPASNPARKTRWSAVLVESPNGQELVSLDTTLPNRLIGEALQHRGYALIDVLQPCVTFNRPSSYDFYKPRVYKLQDSEHDVSDKTAAWQRTFEWDERIPIGIFYQTEDVPTYEEQEPALKAGAPAKKPMVKLQPTQVEALLAETM